MKKKLLQIAKSLDKISFYPRFYSFKMSENEKIFFENIIQNSKNYLEFGSGGSTFRVLQNSKAKVFSVDSNSDWINGMQKYLYIRVMTKWRLSMILVDIGPTREWGHPDGDDSLELYPNYSSLAFTKIPKDNIDTVLIDGRFRVACTLKTIIECHGNHELKIMIHDFPEREEYQVVLKYLTLIKLVDTLGLFRIKEDINIDSLCKDYDDNKYMSA